MDITFTNVSYIYQEDSPFAHQALQNISFYIPSGKYVAIIGHTGSGKSTLIQHLNGLIRPSVGKVKIGEYVLTKTKRPKDMKKLRSQVGMVFQYPEHQLFEETIEKDISFGPRNFGFSEEEIEEAIKELMPKVGLSLELLDRSPFDLSGGQMRRVAIAGVLATRPKVLVLDEPTAGLDPRGQREMMDMFYDLHHREKLTTILVTHSMEDALSYADHVIILKEGTIYMEGPPIEVFLQKEALQEVNLDQPNIIRFLDNFNKKFKTNIKYTGQSFEKIAKSIYQVVQGVKEP